MTAAAAGSGVASRQKKERDKEIGGAKRSKTNPLSLTSGRRKRLVEEDLFRHVDGGFISRSNRIVQCESSGSSELCQFSDSSHFPDSCGNKLVRKSDSRLKKMCV